MRRACATLAALALPVCVKAAEAGGADPGDPWLIWKWVNFLILAAVIGYFIAKTAGSFFRTRTETIQKGIAEAAAIKRDAEERAAAIERKMAGLGGEIERLKAEAKAEFASEGRRIEQETGQLVRRVEQQAEQEIASLSKNARHELKAYAARLAIDLAEQQVRAGMTPEIDRRLVRLFMDGLGGRSNGGSRA